METLNPSAARRIALAAQGFGAPPPAGTADLGHVARTVQRIGLLQIDSVNVLVRAHYMPLFSRLGPYPLELLERAAAGRRRRLVEYWAHEASLVPVSTWPLLRWRMEEARQGRGIYKGLARFAQERPDAVETAYARLVADGPLAASDFDGAKGIGGWWGWSETKRALEYLFWCGRITTASRRPSFERVYDITERVLPALADLPAPAPGEARRELVRIAASALGVATFPDLRDYFRLSPESARPAVDELVEEGSLVPVAVAGWTQPAYLASHARRPRRVEARTLLAPFDPLIFERRRTERLFGLRYRIEIYTPAERRIHGYYVYPFLLGDKIVARVDLKADRRERALHVLSAHAEPGAPGGTAEQLLATLASVAGWLGLERIVIAPRGDLAPALLSLGPRAPDVVR